MPKVWKRHLHPRRGGVPGAKIKLATSPEKELHARHASEMEKGLAHPYTDAELASAGRAHLAGDVSPLGAAVVSAFPRSEYYSGDMAAEFVDAWVTSYGLRFAVAAFAWRCTFDLPGQGAVVKGLRAYQDDRAHFDEMRLGDAAKRLRALVAAADDAEYQEVVGLLAERRTTPTGQILSAYLAPTEVEWVDECCAAPADTFPRQLLLLSLGTPEHLRLLGDQARLTVADCYCIENLITMADGLGVVIAPLLASAFDGYQDEPRRRKALLEVLGRLPSDEAFRLMLDRVGNAHMRAALRETMRRYPVRAIRVLAEGGADELLDEHLRANAELVARVLPDLPAGVRAVVARLSETDDRVPEAPADELPRLLVDPPWARTGPEPEPVVLRDLTPPHQGRIKWASGERAEWLRTEIFTPYPESWHLPPSERGWGDVSEVPPPQPREERWDRWAADLQAGRTDEDEEDTRTVGLLAMGPAEVVRPLLAKWKPAEWERPGGWWSPESWLKVLIARFELDALPLALRFAKARPTRAGEVLLPCLDGRVAVMMADRLLRLKTTREATTAWFARHGCAVVPYLLPVALGEPGRNRSAAENALCFLARQEGDETVVAAARPFGDQVADLVRGLLGRPPVRSIPDRLGVDANVLPQLLLRGPKRALPVSSVRHLLTLLAISTFDEPDPELASVLKVCDERSLAEFGWALFEHWRQDGLRAEDAWQFSALAWLGDDETVRALVPLIRTWPGDGGHHLAVRGLEVLTLIGSELALREMHGIAQKSKYKGLRARAQEKVEQIASARGLTAAELGDRLVPDFGLDARGTLVLDYGPRRFVAGFDEALKSYVIDDDGKRRASLPKPGARDDADLAPAAYRRFADLKKDVRAIASIQLQRLELAMTTGRTWNLADFREFFVEHPLVWHIARRLVWTAERDGAVTAFRLAEDRTFADVSDDVVTISDDAVIGIAHPVRLGESVKAWEEVFADYEITQPFPQLGRPVRALAEEESAAGRLTRFEGVTVPFGNVLRLERRGWRRGPINSDGGIECLVRPVPGGRYVVVTLAHSLVVGNVSQSGHQTLDVVWIGDEPEPDAFSHRSRKDSPHTFGDLDPVTASEVLTDLEAVVAE